MPAQDLPNVTLYSALMDRGLETPLPKWKEGIEMHLRGLSDALARYGEDALRDAYVAGVQDGFVQGVATGHDSSGLSIARDALCEINAYSGDNIMHLVKIASDALYEVDKGA